MVLHKKTKRDNKLLSSCNLTKFIKAVLAVTLLLLPVKQYRYINKLHLVVPTTANAPKNTTGSLLLPCDSNNNKSKTILVAEPTDSLALPLSWSSMMQEAGLVRSAAHQRKFFSVRDSVLSWIKAGLPEQKPLLQKTGKGGHLFAFVLNKNYAFRHIFKSGGTTVQKLLGLGYHGHVSSERVGNRTLITLVRDPVDHFLSGWAECGVRAFDEMANLTASNVYDDRVKAWLQFLQKRHQPSDSQALRRVQSHSMPQANFLWLQSRDQRFQWEEKLAIVGDLVELHGLLELVVGVHYNTSILGLSAKDNEIKMQHFPRNTSLLSNDTMRAICRYTSMDYYLFDFVPPAPCRDELLASIAGMNITAFQYWQ
eukprot:CAMPEP_0181110100 /NCGR_PEP_ID=MMETSP1071-20121207/18534_1 /TAXON_ID=35127 /ORGANISM="Thalassiosira sp., Strain NH16" /LENGTH=367 /DNA_ID=CAMNT_0023193849 /DNA_START=161 /DNA_END=1264 /DNA_ORIENTATION=+